ncbi:Ankyrin-3 [Colletotrichum sp. SAR 10_76]|nr:Ankyrin-3 [Colletotrichum sp. SAR 10_76]
MGLLISRVETIDVADEDGITPLHIAVTTSKYHAQKLLDAGANPNVATNEGLKPLHLAIRKTPSDEYLIKYRDDATIMALRDYDGMKEGTPNRKLLWSILKRRQYYLVEELFHCGVDFFAENQRLGFTGLEELMRGSFTYLVNRILQLEAQRRQEEGVSRVDESITNPRTESDPSWMRKKESDKSSRQFIPEAIHMELPVFDVLCLLVE